VSLDSWNERRRRHFGELAVRRPEGPIFALEHRLAGRDLADLTNDLDASPRRAGYRPPQRHPELRESAECMGWTGVRQDQLDNEGQRRL
jgi:hypothetical protein